MSLREYKRKRDFKKTPEPEGRIATEKAGRQFVIQKHAASRLHYDFRLELDGTLKSWALPKGPSLDPTVKSLAVQVEDHPLEYGSFEGVIPQGEYGGGTVMVWDRGTWVAEGDGASGYKRGKLSFQLQGEKLRGSWTLVRMGGRDNENKKNWLLIKQRDREARPNARLSLLVRKPRSVISNRTMEQIAAAADRVWSSRSDVLVVGNGKPRSRTIARRGRTNRVAKVNEKRPRRRPAGSHENRRQVQELAKFAGSLSGARRSQQPGAFKPQLATLASEVPSGDGWLHELKFDGYRILAFFNHGRVRLVTRQGKDWTERFGSLAVRFAELPCHQSILDGEVVVLDDDGISDFQQLQNFLKRGSDSSLVCYLFDIPHFAGWDLRQTPLLERKELLSRLLRSKYPQNDGPLRLSDHIIGQGKQIWQHACRGAMEGIVSKRVESGYYQSRSPNWIKVKCLKRQEFVIGGFTKPSGSRIGFGALLLGYYRGDDLVYCGRVGTGFTQDSLRQIKTELRLRVTDSPAFSNPPTGAQRRGVFWVRPELVGEVEFTEWTADGSLRHPSFQGLREDKPPRQVFREQPKSIKALRQSAGRISGRHSQSAPTEANSNRGKRSDEDDRVAGVRITHPDRVLYQEEGITKLDLAKFYERISDWILPHVIGRPLTLVRCPTGPQGACFYQKHLTGSLPDVIRGVMIQEKNKREKYVVVDELPGLISLVQMGVLEFHPWPARADNVERPDRLVFDLDPGEGVPWEAVVQAARDVRELLAELELESFLRTSGGKGLHVVVPLARRNSWDDIKAFAKGVADTLVKASPERYIATMSKAKRRGKVFVDYLRNQRGATAIASYSTRARPGAAVATPLSWSELTLRLKPDAYRVANLPKRLESLQADPWADFFTSRQSLTKKMLAVAKYE